MPRSMQEVHEKGAHRDYPRKRCPMCGDGCGRCHRAVEPGRGFVVYQEPGGRDAGSKNRIVVHDECIADEVAAGRLMRVSAFAFEVLPVPEPCEP